MPQDGAEFWLETDRFPPEGADSNTEAPAGEPFDSPAGARVSTWPLLHARVG